MKTNLHLSIANPCAENWGNFTSTAEGRHCSRCNKVVVDFTSMSDEKIARFFQQRNSGICGRLNVKQLKTFSYSANPQIKPGLGLLKAGILGTLLLLSLPAVVHAQAEKSKTEQVVEKVAQTSASAKEHVVGGVVRSQEDHTPLSGVNVMLKGSTVGTVTDGEGKFEFPQKLSKGDILQFSFIGLVTEELAIPDLTAKEPVEINMKMSFELMGEVAVNEVYSEPPSRLRTWWTRVKNLF
ncbi:MAG TPA: carboxypeptidase-like regulatory domain-containing protein [Cyclobacteriaceae bacterium]|jgi:hypothetical protein|nr:carboxypeptidase-like regulatory domain-containing protein [Cyclobacteriaceae bacterium]